MTISRTTGRAGVLRGGFLWSAALAVALAWIPSAGAQPPAADKADKAVDKKPDGQVLDDLDTELLKDLDPGRPKDPPRTPPRDAGEQPPAAGEDIELESVNPLSRIAGRMRTVEERIGSKQTGAETRQLQQRIVAELDALIQQAEEQAQSSQSQQSRASGAGNDADGARSSGSQPARESTQRVGTSEQVQADLDQFERLIKEVWGHLPAQVRQQMMQGRVEQFLPRYERMIEQYYQRLAEEPR